MHFSKVVEFRRGFVIFASLALLTALEYVLGTHGVLSVFLWIIALTKAALIIWFFMHIFRVFGSSDKGVE